MTLHLISDRGRVRPWLLIAAASLVTAFLSAFASFVNSRFVGRGVTDWTGVFFGGFLWLSFGALTPIIYVLARRFPLRRELLVRTISAHLAGAVILCMVGLRRAWGWHYS